MFAAGTRAGSRSEATREGTNYKVSWGEQLPYPWGPNTTVPQGPYGKTQLKGLIRISKIARVYCYYATGICGRK